MRRISMLLLIALAACGTKRYPSGVEFYIFELGFEVGQTPFIRCETDSMRCSGRISRTERSDKSIRNTIGSFTKNEAQYLVDRLYKVSDKMYVFDFFGFFQMRESDEACKPIASFVQGGTINRFAVYDSGSEEMRRLEEVMGWLMGWQSRVSAHIPLGIDDMLLMEGGAPLVIDVEPCLIAEGRVIDEISFLFPPEMIHDLIHGSY